MLFPLTLNSLILCCLIEYNRLRANITVWVRADLRCQKRQLFILYQIEMSKLISFECCSNFNFQIQSFIKHRTKVLFFFICNKIHKWRKTGKHFSGTIEFKNLLNSDWNFFCSLVNSNQFRKCRQCIEPTVLQNYIDWVPCKLILVFLPQMFSLTASCFHSGVFTATYHTNIQKCSKSNGNGRTCVYVGKLRLCE